MYWNDHPPPHVHAYYGGFEALFAIETGTVIGGHLPAKVEKLRIRRTLSAPVVTVAGV